MQTTEVHFGNWDKKTSARLLYTMLGPYLGGNIYKPRKSTHARTFKNVPNDQRKDKIAD